MKTFELALLACGLLAGAGALAQQAQPAQVQADNVTVKRATELREAPGEASRSLAALPAQSQVTRLAARQGPWIEVRNAQGQTGWIHMFDIGANPPAPASGGNVATGALRGLTSLFGSGGGSTQARTASTATIGIRGLGAEDIANAQPNLAALAQADTLRVDAAQAQRFGAAAALTAQPVPALPVPPPPAPASGNTGEKR
jgi:hypothetical protein